MKRLTIATLLVALALPMTTALADDQECTTADVEWIRDGEQPHLTNVHYALIGVRIALVGDYFWTQYETTSDPTVGGEILSTQVPKGVTNIIACPDGLVTLISATPPVEDNDVEVGPAVYLAKIVGNGGLSGMPGR